jgi:hypothetical protein
MAKQERREREPINWQHHAAMSPTLAYMVKRGLPLTRENFIELAYGGDRPEPWTAEHEADIPYPFQHTED